MTSRKRKQKEATSQTLPWHRTPEPGPVSGGEMKANSPGYALHTPSSPPTKTQDSPTLVTCLRGRRVQRPTVPDASQSPNPPYRCLCVRFAHPASLPQTTGTCALTTHRCAVVILLRAARCCAALCRQKPAQQTAVVLEQWRVGDPRIP